MKQAFNVNIGGRAYNIAEDAYELLDKYLNDISSRLTDTDVESMDDIESRIADIFDETISSQMQVVNLEMVRRTMAVIGRPEMFGGQKRGFSYQQNNQQNYQQDYQQDACPHEPRKLYRSANNRIIGGVCGGLAEYMDVDPTLIRVITVILFFATIFSIVPIYIVMWIVIPKRPDYLNPTGGYRHR